jgi:hypothetical protein
MKTEFELESGKEYEFSEEKVIFKILNYSKNKKKIKVEIK